MTGNQSNDQLALTPRAEFDGPALSFDWPGLLIGVAEYDEGPTGCTVFRLPPGSRVAMDVRGGSPGVTGDYETPDAICLAGGSLYGLEAASGVAAELFAQAGYSTAFDKIGLVSGAIIYDYPRRANAIYPDKALGRAALRAARAGRIPLGSRGAGISAGVGGGPNWDGGEPGGQGAAFRQIGPTKIVAFTVVNAIGMIHGRDGGVLRGGLSRVSGKRRSYLAQLEAQLASAGAAAPPERGNTTLSVLVTNQKLGSWELRQLARSAHSSMCRAIQPFHTIYDGDVLFGVSTQEVDNPALDAVGLGVLAAEVMWDAVLRVAES
jgi:L-aminopeptidase/D-esterase-like protein